jgi:hypothetical protein
MKKIESGIDARRTTRRSVTLMLAAVALGLLASTTARADDSVGTVTQVSGSAQIQRAGATLPAQQGTVVKVHDTVTTQPDASVTLGFSDGSSMALSGNTSIAIADTAAANGQMVPSRVTLISGDIHTIVPDKTGQPHSIEVNTENAKVTGPSPNQ